MQNSIIKNWSTLDQQEQLQPSILDKIRSHPSVNKLKGLLVGWAMIAWANQINAQDIQKTIDPQEIQQEKKWPSELLKKIRSNYDLIKDLDNDLRVAWYEDTLAMATDIVNNVKIDQLETRSVHNLHISFRLPADVNLGTTYIPTLINNLNNILTNTYNPLPGEDYYISWRDLKKLPANYDVSRWGNVDLTLAGNPTSIDMLSGVSMVTDDVGETCLVTVVVPLSAGSNYKAWFANRVSGTNLLNTPRGVTVMKSSSNTEILVGAWALVHEVLWHLAGYYYPGWPDTGIHTTESCNGWNRDYMNPNWWNAICTTSQSNIAADLGPDGGWDVWVCTQYPLPLHLLSERASSLDEYNNKIEWIVADEWVKEYEIEHSTDAKSRQVIGEISAVNNTHKHSYSYIHKEAAGLSYYRIKGIDMDGTHSYIWKIMTVAKKGKESMVAYPSPTSDMIHVVFTWADGKKADIEVYNIMGQKIKDIDDVLVWENNQLDLSDTPSGMYIIRGEVNWKQYDQKIIKQ